MPRRTIAYTRRRRRIRAGLGRRHRRGPPFPRTLMARLQPIRVLVQENHFSTSVIQVPSVVMGV